MQRLFTPTTVSSLLTKKSSHSLWLRNSFPLVQSHRTSYILPRTELGKFTALEIQEKVLSLLLDYVPPEEQNSVSCCFISTIDSV